MSIRKLAVTALTGAATVLTPLTQTIGSTAAIRGAAAVTVASAAAMTPTLAHAQSGKRLCAVSWLGDSGGKMGIMIEVYKWDVFTCSASVAAMWAWGGVSNLRGLASTLLGGFPNANSFRTRGGPAFMETCESYTRRALDNRYGGNVCHSMQDYKWYVFGTVYDHVVMRKL